ncbi:MAG: hypothetical protein ACXWXT_19015, partial [Candidatus Binatia bacterium]
FSIGVNMQSHRGKIATALAIVASIGAGGVSAQQPSAKKTSTLRSKQHWSRPKPGWVRALGRLGADCIPDRL